MIHRPGRFNLYLVASLLLLAVWCGSGCETFGHKDKKEESSLRLHLEVNPSQGTNVIIGRTSQFTLSVDPTPFLTEFNMEWAKVVDTIGGFSIAIQYNAEGTILLEQYSTVHRGRHVGILAEFGQFRWLAAPIIQKRITNGQFVFTPDASREEADKLVLGLNHIAEQVRKGTK